MALTESDDEHSINILQDRVTQLELRISMLERVLRVAMQLLSVDKIDPLLLEEWKGARNDLVDVVKDILKNDGESDAN